MKRVRVRPYARRRVHNVKLEGRRRPSTSGRLGAIIDDVVEGRRAGVTWTSRWRFDIDDPEQMRRVYDMLHDRILYAVATTNLTLVEREQELALGRGPTFSANEGISLWKRADGTVFMDDIVLFFAPKTSEEWVLKYAKSKQQQVILKVDGEARTWSFLDVPGWHVAVRGEGAERVFEPEKA